MPNFINILNKKFEIIDAIEYITLADSFVKNKIGSGNGEAKLYVGNEGQRVSDFFRDYNFQCFFLKSDFSKFLMDAKSEFLNPQQQYNKKSEMPTRFSSNLALLDSFAQNLLSFQIYRTDVNPPRVYIKSNSIYYDFMRAIGLPNISYLSILKIRGEDSKVYLYFKMFIDYTTDLVNYTIPDEVIVTEAIMENDQISKRTKESLIQSRVGQGDYRDKLLLECPYCPFTLVNDERLLIASHIKPWSKSDDNEKIDPKNGFMLTPTFDKLFDKGFITFNEDKTLIVSPWLSPMNQKRFGIYTGKKIDALPLDEKRIKYLRYHKESVFKS